MGVDHLRAHVIVSEQFLNRSNIVAVLQQTGCKGMKQGVTPSRFKNARFDSCFLECFLKHCFMKVVPTMFSG